jgi:hypothetical protein
LREVPGLGQDVRHCHGGVKESDSESVQSRYVRQLVGRPSPVGNDADKPRVAILDPLMAKAWPKGHPNFHVLGALPSESARDVTDVVPPVDAHSDFLVHRGRGPVGKAHLLEGVTTKVH